MRLKGFPKGQNELVGNVVIREARLDTTIPPPGIWCLIPVILSRLRHLACRAQPQLGLMLSRLRRSARDLASSIRETRPTSPRHRRESTRNRKECFGRGRTTSRSRTAEMHSWQRKRLRLFPPLPLPTSKRRSLISISVICRSSSSWRRIPEKISSERSARTATVVEHGPTVHREPANHHYLLLCPSISSASCRQSLPNEHFRIRVFNSDRVLTQSWPIRLTRGPRPGAWFAYTSGRGSREETIH